MYKEIAKDPASLTSDPSEVIVIADLDTFLTAIYGSRTIPQYAALADAGRVAVRQGAHVLGSMVL